MFMEDDENDETYLQDCPICGGRVGLNEGVITTITCHQCEMLFVGRTRQNMLEKWNEIPRHSIIKQNEKATEQLERTLRGLGSLLASWGRELGYKGSDGEIIAIMRKIKTMTPMESKFQNEIDQKNARIKELEDELSKPPVMPDSIEITSEGSVE